MGSAGMPSIPSGVLPDAEGVAALDGVGADVVLPDAEGVAALDGVGATVDGVPPVSSTEAGDGAIEVVSVCAAGSCAGRAAAPS